MSRNRIPSSDGASTASRSLPGTKASAVAAPRTDARASGPRLPVPAAGACRGRSTTRRWPSSSRNASLSPSGAHVSPGASAQDSWNRGVRREPPSMSEDRQPLADRERQPVTGRGQGDADAGRLVPAGRPGIGDADLRPGPGATAIALWVGKRIRLLTHWIHSRP